VTDSARVLLASICVLGVATYPAWVCAAGPSSALDAPVVTGNGAGPFEIDAAVDLAAIKKALPGQSVSVEDELGELEEVQTWLTVKKAGRIRFRVELTSDKPPKVRRIEVYDPKAESPSGLRVGQPYAKLGKLGQPTCTMVQLAEDGLFFCSYAKEKNIYYVFPSGPLAATPTKPAATARMVCISVGMVDAQ
jgi:hypothetical protein